MPNIPLTSAFPTTRCCGSYAPGDPPPLHCSLRRGLPWTFPLPTHHPPGLGVCISPRGPFNGLYLPRYPWPCVRLGSLSGPHGQRKKVASEFHFQSSTSCHSSVSTAVNPCPILMGGVEYQLADFTARFFQQLFHRALSRTPPVRCVPLMQWGDSP